MFLTGCFNTCLGNPDNYSKLNVYLKVPEISSYNVVCVLSLMLSSLLVLKFYLCRRWKQARRDKGGGGGEGGGQGRGLLTAVPRPN